MKKYKRKIKWKNIFIIILPLVILAETACLIFFDGSYTQLVNAEVTYQTEIQEKENKIIELEKTQKELKNQIEKLETENKKLKATTTSKSSSSSTKTSVTASSTPGWVWANVSAYCACVKCCGKTNGITASGAKAKANHTIAAPSTYKFGTKIEIAGMGVYTVEDRGGAITGNKLDIYFDSHSEALKFGRKQLQIRVVK